MSLPQHWSVIYQQIALCTLSLFAGQSEKLGLVQTHVKLCKDVSNDGLYHVVMNYDVYVGFYIISPKRCMNIALLALCLGLLTPTLIAGTALSTQEDLHTTNVSYNLPDNSVKTSLPTQTDGQRFCQILDRQC